MSNFCTDCPYCAQHDNRIDQNRKEVEEMAKVIQSDSWWGRVLGFAGVALTAFCGLIGVIIGFIGQAKGWW